MPRASLCTSTYEAASPVEVVEEETELVAVEQVVLEKVDVILLRLIQPLL